MNVLLAIIALFIPPCATEDASGVCIWNATTQGNGVGHSFIVDANDNVHYLD